MIGAWERAVRDARNAVRDPGRTRAERARNRVRAAVEALCAEEELCADRSLGPHLAELVALLDGLGLSDTSGALLDHVVASLRVRPGLLITLAPALDRLAVALAAHGRYDAATWVTAASVEDATEPAAALANLAHLTLRRGDTVGATEFGLEARRFAARAGSELAELDVAVLETAVSAEAARREGLHAAADRLVDELAGYVKRLAALAGDDHPASQSALAALASTEFASAEAAGARARMERAADVLAVVAQRMSATLGGHHPRALSVLRGLAAAEYQLARTSGDARRLAGAEVLMAEAARRTEVRGPEERRGRAGRGGAGGAARPGWNQEQLMDVAESVIRETELLLAGERVTSLLHGADPVDARGRFDTIHAQLDRARVLLNDRPSTAYALALDALHQLDELTLARADASDADALNSSRRPSP
ncbi:hypothetical protein [Actinacidiphila paucisporea]|uniref:Tetratricopeptide repeat protein n=1 Tax=Actinacidiphila paucisporea TaxID=310782 RepID=A0A1M7QX53_9ACTN|nr:hypothetical protein [Actinacidiphila paucisporea]SHN36232.1 hypothetical protein SAMN05216499_1468 [Actinacidiphila paucisporea]